ncbi:hypothetical protein FJQ98_16760 [Lysinibacillus agricola]|uniref:NDxxF motif lipoprotein n=1 Tax=Lysinibacillus agricola TaxID=2590012 RepID=A0ABX7AMB3_9BACI|nr:MULTISPECIES: hypothetical protein [Lysinibacillus]KOS61423.1 hypothetical protein AN161_17670 [Lysinibacillus sp. FJAT-14222]QQP10896.1 hypothetical protein FJQ98_16760 [Lysinibacillus agricola]
MKFNRLWMVLICFSFLLSACGKENNEKVSASAEPKVDLSSYPVGVQERKISLEYYNILLEANTKLGEFNKNLKNASGNDIEEKKNLYRKFLVYVNGVSYTPVNDAEKEIDNYFSSFLYNAKLYSEHQIKSYDSKSELDSSVAKDYAINAQNDMLMVTEIMDKYQLFNEN